MNPLARIVYNMVAEGGDDVLRAAGRAAKKVDPRAAKEAVNRVADDVVEAADDWGWKGGKPGEISGSKWLAAEEDYTPKGEQKYEELLDKLTDKFEGMDPKSSTWSTFARLKSAYSPFHGMRSAARQAAGELQTTYGRLEQAGVPREYTGKLANAVLQRTSGIRSIDKPTAEKLSGHMRTMTKDQREEFLALLPEWTESLDDLANAVKTF